MTEYIERDAVLKMLNETYDRMNAMGAQFYNGFQNAVGHVEAFPAADVVEVVRCKDCAVPHNHLTGCPWMSGRVTPPDFFCGFGERKDGVEDA